MPWLHAFVDVPADQRATAAAFWSEALGWSAILARVAVTAAGGCSATPVGERFCVTLNSPEQTQKRDLG